MFEWSINYKLLEVYMIVNFKIYKINQIIYKLIKTFMLIKNKKNHACIYRLVCLYYLSALINSRPIEGNTFVFQMI